MSIVSAKEVRLVRRQDFARVWQRKKHPPGGACRPTTGKLGIGHLRLLHARLLLELLERALVPVTMGVRSSSMADEEPSELVPRAGAMGSLRATIKRATKRLLAPPSEEAGAEGEDSAKEAEGEGA